jgi:hypothetical protein
MEERDHYLSKQYHRELLNICEQEILLRAAQTPSLKRLDQLMDRSGDLLISLGQRLKSHSTTPDLSGECV